MTRKEIANSAHSRNTGSGEFFAQFRILSLVVKFRALVFILFLPTKFALDLRLLGGVWILQTFPAQVFGLFVGWFGARALLCGWAVGIVGGSWMAFADGINPVHTFVVGGDSYTMYTGLIALTMNIVAAVVANLVLGRGPQPALKQ